MTSEIIFSGFGGQGIILMGQMLAQAGLEAEKHVTWFPSYGPEMRGGTAYCSIVISDSAIGSPVIVRPDILTVMNSPSLLRFADSVKPEGTLIINSSLVEERSTRTDIKQVCLPMNKVAEELNQPRALNCVALGVMAGTCPIIEKEAFVMAINTLLGKKFAAKPTLLELNRQAFLTGYDSAQKV